MATRRGVERHLARCFGAGHAGPLIEEDKLVVVVELELGDQRSKSNARLRAANRAKKCDVDGVKTDGLGADDMDEVIGLMTAIAAAADEAKDTDAFALHLISELADQIGDRRVDPPAV